MQQDWLNAFWGGIIIGVAVSLMLLFNGRVTGISGIINGALSPVRGDTNWRIIFLLGLFIGGLILKFFNPNIFFEGQVDAPQWTVIAAGLLVGFGTILGSGCTSGHGICGISRLSLRSVAATVVFVTFGIISVFIFKKIGVLP